MTDVQQNILVKRNALGALKQHPMCFEVADEDEKLIIIFPYEVAGIGGVRVDNTAKGITQAEDACENAWNQSSLRKD